MLLDALMNMDREQLRQLAAAAVQRFAGMEPGRPVGGTYYLYRTLRQLDADGLVAQDDGRRRSERRARSARARSTSGSRAKSSRAGCKVLKEMIEAEIRRRLVADRGVEAMARTLRKPLPEDVDFMHASREEMQQLQQAIYPLTRALAARLAQRRRHRHRGHLDFRQTVRALAVVRRRAGRAEVQAARTRRSPRSWWSPTSRVRWRASPASRCSSSTRWQSEFSKVRSWVFIDGIDEVTRFFDESDELTDGDPPRQHRGRRRVGRRPLRLRPRVRGLARPPHPRGHAEDVDHPARRRAQQLPRVAGVDRSTRCASAAGTSTGSTPSRAATGTPATRSSPSTAPYCDGVYECRNLRQLQQFVGTIADGLTADRSIKLRDFEHIQCA